MANILCCDKCGKTPAKRFSVAVSKYTDGAGSRDTHDAVFDLCAECSASGLQTLLAQFALQGNETTALVKMVLGKSPEVA